MADIELVIKIPERIHYGIEKGITVNGSQASQILIDAVKNGTPLPKGHGRLGDLSVLDKIRAEIENDWQLKKYPSSPFSCGLRHAIEIIDKHKSKREVNND